MSQNNNRIAYNYGLVYGLIAVAMAVVQYSLGDFKTSMGNNSFTIWTGLGIAMMVGFPLAAMLKRRKEQGEQLTYGQGFKTGFTVAVIGSLFTAAWMLLYTLALEPGYQEEVINNSYQQLQQQNIGKEQMEASIEVTKQFTAPHFMALFTILSAAFMGAIISLILAAFTRKQPPVA